MTQLVHLRDPIHGSIELDMAELRVVESRAFQRLRAIKQLGFNDHAFPGATHTRFAHSLGAAQVAGRVFDAIFPPAGRGPLPAEERLRLRTILRLAVLLHDVGHAPLSHATEFSLPLRGKLALDCFGEAEKQQRAVHEDLTLLLVLRSDLVDILRQEFGALGIEPEDVAQLIGGRHPDRAASFVVNGVDYGPLLSQIVAGELDADRMDYLLRDSFYTGVTYGNFDEQWLLTNLGFHVEHDRAYLAFSHRAIFAFEDFLLSRYHMFVSVYYHHTAIGIDEMLARLIEEEPEAFALPASADAYLQHDDITFWSILRASNNRWARRIATRDLYRRVLEINAEEGMPDVSKLEQTLDDAGIEHFVSRDEGVLSRYYGGDSEQTPIYVVNDTLGRATRVETYSRLFERYAQPTRLIRVYCRPDQRDQARSCLRQCLSQGEREQLRLQLK